MNETTKGFMKCNENAQERRGQKKAGETECSLKDF